MNTFYIVRHGETENNRTGRLSGWIDTPLTSEGEAATQKVIAKLTGVQFEAVFASDLGRAFITAYVVARGLGLQDKEIVRLPALREVNYGAANNMPRAEAYGLYPDLDRNTHYAPPDGESLDTMQRRVFAALAEIDTAHTDTTILIVAHSGAIAAIRAQHVGQDFGAHNISEAYPHDYVGQFTLRSGEIASFTQVV